MKVVKEELDGEIYVDLIISPDELEMISEYHILAKNVHIEEKTVNIGIRLETEAEDDRELE